MQAALLTLVQTTVRQPRTAAGLIIAMGLKRDVLWTGLALGAVLYALVMQLILAISEPTVGIPTFARKPLVLFVIVAGGLVVFVHALHWVSRALGGKGTLWDMLGVMVWLQILRAFVQLALLIITLALPALGVLLTIVVGIWGLWIMFHFIAAAGQLPTAGHGIAVVVIAAVGLVLGLSVFLSLIGLSAQGVMS